MNWNWLLVPIMFVFWMIFVGLGITFAVQGDWIGVAIQSVGVLLLGAWLFVLVYRNFKRIKAHKAYMTSLRGKDNE